MQYPVNRLFFNTHAAVQIYGSQDAARKLGKGDLARGNASWLSIIVHLQCKQYLLEEEKISTKNVYLIHSQSICIGR